MNNKIIKETAQEALDCEYGFKPALKDITLLEASDDRTYILFEIKGRQYRFSSYKFSNGAVWVGPGPIEKRS